jgi:hypothetical protein
MKSRDQWLGIQGWGLVICVATVMAMGVTHARSLVASEGKSDLTMTVRVYDYAAVPPGTLRGAEEEASRILRAAGVELAWLDCPESGGVAKNPACEPPLGATGIDLRILDPAMAARIKPGREQLGFALPSARLGSASDAWVFYHRVEQLAESKVADRAQILGHAIAHEVGHLLLGPDRHSSRGIMRANWDRGYLQDAARGQLLFTREQAEFIRAEVGGRREQQKARQSPGLAAVE